MANKKRHVIVMPPFNSRSKCCPFRSQYVQIASRGMNHADMAFVVPLRKQQTKGISHQAPGGQ